VAAAAAVDYYGALRHRMIRHPAGMLVVVVVAFESSRPRRAGP
jgi:hypothetical protein